MDEFNLVSGRGISRDVGIGATGARVSSPIHLTSKNANGNNQLWIAGIVEERRKKKESRVRWLFISIVTRGVEVEGVTLRLRARSRIAILLYHEVLFSFFP